MTQGCVRLGQALETPAPGRDGQQAVVFFRPEDVHISGDGKGQPALIEARMFQGLLTRVQLCIEHEQPVRIHAELPSREAVALEPGTLVRVKIPQEVVHVFPLEE